MIPRAPLAPLVPSPTPPRAIRVATIARRPDDEAELTDGTCTPAWLAALLPTFGMDVCTNNRSHIRARVHVVKTSDDLRVPSFDATDRWIVADGLEIGWSSSIFQNIPFSDPMPWMAKLQREIAARHTEDAVTLCKLDPGTKWWRELVKPTGHVTLERWEFSKRVQYDEHPDIVERRRIKNIIKAMAGDPEKGIEPRTREWCEAHVTGKSQANFNSVIIHHRGAGYPPLGLESVATRWVIA